MKKIRLGLFGRIIVGILCGVALGFAFAHLGGAGEVCVRVFKTFNVLFGQLLKFIVPLIILGLVTPAIADAGKGAGKLLVTVMVFSYISTCAASLFADFTSDSLSFIHRRLQDADGYFVAQPNRRPIGDVLTFRSVRKEVELWDAVTGEIRAARDVVRRGETTSLCLPFDACGSLFVVFREAAKSWPEWFLANRPSPTGRHAFSTCRLWTKDDELLPAGLLGLVKFFVQKCTQDPKHAYVACTELAATVSRVV